MSPKTFARLRPRPFRSASHASRPTAAAPKPGMALVVQGPRPVKPPLTTNAAAPDSGRFGPRVVELDIERPETSTAAPRAHVLLTKNEPSTD